MAGPIYPYPQEFDYYGSTVPASPAGGETWRETTASGKLVNDWEWEESVSRWIAQFGSYQAERVVLSATGTRLVPIPASPGEWAFRMAFQLAANIALNASERWTVDTSFFVNSIADGQVEIDHELAVDVVEGQAEETAWALVTDAYHARFDLNKIGSASYGLYGTVSVERRRVRNS